jgi:transposase
MRSYTNARSGVGLLVLDLDLGTASGFLASRRRTSPWKESCIVDQRLQFLSSYQKEEMSVSDLCREFGVSRPTGYRWINRNNEIGPEGLLDLSRRPHSCSHATPEAIENAILALRGRYPLGGARKLKARLEKLEPNVTWPAASTFGSIFEQSRPDESEAEEATDHSLLGAVLRGDGSESAVVHGL